MKNTNVTTSWMLLGIFVAQTLMPFGGVISRAYAYDNSICDAFCGQIISNGQVMNLAGTGQWSSTDASTCSAWSSSEYNPSAMPSPLPSPWPSTSAQQFQCQWSQNSQAVDQCLAYEAAQGSNFEKVLISLDIAAAGLCATACFTKAFSAGTGDRVCSGATAAVSAVDLLSEISMKSSAAGLAINTALGASGVVAGISIATESGPIANAANNATGKLKESCVMMAFMAVMAALRATNFGNDQETKQSACTAIQSLMSTASTAGSNPASLYPNGVPTMSGVTGTGTGSSGSGGTSPQVGVSCAQQGMGAGGCGLSSEQLSQPDAAALNSGLGQAAVPAAMALQGAGFNPSDPGSIGAALSSGVGGGEAGEALKKLADTVAAHAGELGTIGGAEAKSGGAPGAAATAKALNFDFGGGGGAAAPAADMNFDGARQLASAGGSGDIWHTGYKGSLFDIVSKKISTNLNQVDQIPWATPLNCALAGGCVKQK